MGRCLGYGITAKKVAPDLSNLDAILGQIEDAGCTTAELTLADLHVIAGGRVLRPAMDRLTGILARRRLRYTVHGPLAINLCLEGALADRHLRALNGCLEAASDAGAVHYVMHAGYLPWAKRDGMEAAYARQRERLSGIADRVRALGLILCVENVFPGFDGELETPSPSRLARELALIDHPNIRATLDFGHARLHAAKTGGDFLAEIPHLAPFAKHLHVHDSFGIPDESWTISPAERMAMGEGDIHLPIGWGDAPWERMLAACTFPDGVIFNAEPAAPYWHAVPEIAQSLRDLVAQARIA
jgi:sugar phosphate isomerase/epimerase